MCSPHEDYSAQPGGAGGAGTAAGQLGWTRTRALCEPRGATGDGERLPAPPGIPASSGPFSYSWLGGAVVASWPVCLTRTPPSLHAASRDPTASQICAFPAVGPNSSTESSPSQPFPIPLCPRIPHGPSPASPCYTDPTSAESSGKPQNPALRGISQLREHPGLQSRLCGHPSPCSPAPVPAAVPAAGPAGTERAGRSQTQPFLCSGLSEGARPSPLPHFCYKIHVRGFSHSANTKDTSPCVSRLQQSQAGLNPFPVGTASSHLLSCAGVCTCG